MRAATKRLHSVCAIWLCVAVTAQSAQAQRALDTAIERASDFSSERHLNGLSLPIWGGVRLEAMEMENAHRRIEISVPFQLLPATRFHRAEHDIESPYGYARQKGGAQSLRMSLPYGLTLEAGSQIDPFGRRHNDFIGLTFRLSDTRHHHQRIAAYKGASRSLSRLGHATVNFRGLAWSAHWLWLLPLLAAAVVAVVTIMLAIQVAATVPGNWCGMMSSAAIVSTPANGA